MTKNQFGEIVLNEEDLVDLTMQGKDIAEMRGVTIDPNLNLESLIQLVENPQDLLTWTFPTDGNIGVLDFDLAKQSNWHMPDEYKALDIAAYILDLCKTDTELQRVGEELLLYQEHNLFDLLRYLKYLVDVMRANHVIWGVGRGSSVASYVLYLLGVHRINSMFYDLDPREFLR